MRKWRTLLGTKWMYRARDKGEKKYERTKHKGCCKEEIL